jgi:hypothetical protein
LGAGFVAGEEDGVNPERVATEGGAGWPSPESGAGVFSVFLVVVAVFFSASGEGAGLDADLLSGLDCAALTSFSSFSFSFSLGWGFESRFEAEDRLDLPLTLKDIVYLWTIFLNALKLELFYIKSIFL